MAAGVRTGELSAAELVADALSAAAALDPALHFVDSLAPDSALEAAARIHVTRPSVSPPTWAMPGPTPRWPAWWPDGCGRWQPPGRSARARLRSGSLTWRRDGCRWPLSTAAS
jgi:hypothetical protein